MPAALKLFLIISILGKVLFSSGKIVALKLFEQTLVFCESVELWIKVPRQQYSYDTQNNSKSFDISEKTQEENLGNGDCLTPPSSETRSAQY